MPKYSPSYLQIQLDRVRERLLVAIEYLPDEALLIPNAIGDWSVADLLAHVTVWEAELVTGLMRLDQGRKPEKLLATLTNPTAYTQRRYNENKGRSLDAIFDDFQKVRMQLESWLEEFSPKTLNNPQQYKWFKGKPLGQIIAQVTYENEAKYLPALEQFAAQWEAMELTDHDDSTVIPLLSLDVLEQNDEEE